MKELKIYFAAPVFTQAERIWNRMLKKELEKIAETRGLKIKILFPQNIAAEILNDERYSYEHKLGRLAKTLDNKLLEADLMVSILDGADTDSGTSGETYAAKIIGKKVVGVLRTDFRGTGEEKGLNMVLSRACNKLIIFPSFNESIEELAEKIIDTIIELYINPV